jgi:ParB-like chromosome segregation protein Spo0J
MARKQKTKTLAGPLILNERTELVPIDSIHPHERNVNQADLGAIIESIGVHGFYGTVIVQKSTGAILCGTHRWRAAHEKGYQQIPVTFIDVSDSQAVKIMLADNRTARLGTDDNAALADLLQALSNDGGIQGTGYDQEALDQLIADLGSGSLTGAGAFDESDRLKEQFQILITCESEFQQATLLERLNAEGLKCRALLS